MAKRPEKTGLARAVVEARKKAGLPTQHDLAEAAGISIATVKNLEAGYPVDNKRGTLSKVAKAVGLGLPELLRRAGLQVEDADLRKALVKFRASTWNTHHLANSKDGVITPEDEREILDDPPSQLVGPGLDDETIAHCVEMVRAARRAAMSVPSAR